MLYYSFYYVLISVDHATKQIWTVISVNSIRLLISGLMLPAAAARPWATLVPRVNKRILLTSQPVKICILSTGQQCSNI